MVDEQPYVSDWLPCPFGCGYAEFSEQTAVHLRRHHDLTPDRVEQIVREALAVKDGADRG